MFKKILNILTLILVFKSITSLNSSDLCKSYFKCNGEKYKYQCSKSLCALNEETCNDYNDMLKIHFFHTSYGLLKILANIHECEPKSNKILNKIDYCIRNKNCFKKQTIWSLGFKVIKQRVDCKCEGKYSFKCGNEYCSFSSQYCDFLNLKIKYQKKFNKTDAQNCVKI